MVGVTVRQTVQCCMFIPGGVGRHVYMHYAVPVVSKCVIPPVEYCGYCAAAKDAPRKLESTATELGQEGQHPLTGQRAANFRLLANQ